MARAATITHINIYIGDTLRKHTNTMDEITIIHDHHLILVALIMSYIGTPMRATTTGLIPLKALTTYSLSLKPVKKSAISNIIRKGGRQLPMVATRLPAVPRSLCPVLFEIFAAKSPGAVWARAIISKKSSSLSHFLLTSSLFMELTTMHTHQKQQQDLFLSV